MIFSCVLYLFGCGRHDLYIYSLWFFGYNKIPFMMLWYYVIILVLSISLVVVGCLSRVGVICLNCLDKGGVYVRSLGM